MIELKTIATAMRRSAYNAYVNTLIGNAPKSVVDAGERMRNPTVGDWVIETTTVRRFRNEAHTDLDGVGILEEATREPVDFSDPDFVWDEEAQGQPHPTERVYYIRTIDGRRFRWVNASIVAILTEHRPLLP